MFIAFKNQHNNRVSVYQLLILNCFMSKITMEQKKCSQCELSFGRSDTLKRHIDNAHADKIRCNFCKKMINPRKDIKER